MDRTPEQDFERELQDPEYVKLYGASDAKAEFAILLSRVRREANKTQQELADEIGSSQPYIAKLEGGDANPTLGAVGSILAVLGFRLVMDIKPLLQHESRQGQVSGWETARSGSLTGAGSERSYP